MFQRKDVSSYLLTTLFLIGYVTGSTEMLGDKPPDSTIFTYQWAVHVNGGDHVANAIAQKHGFTNLGKIVGDYYHFKHNKVAKRSVEMSNDHHKLLLTEPEIRWAQQQVVKRRIKRSVFDAQANNGLGNHRVNRSPTIFNLNDPGWSQMWYLNRGNGRDMNVQEVWADGITGKGSVVSILDDGLEKDHPDISRNYDPRASFDVNDQDDDPSPFYDSKDSNRHGTRCAGEVAAQSNNSICAVGVAFDAQIGGVRMLDGDVTDAVEARSLSFNSQHIDIYSASWGPDDDGKTVDGPGELATRAFMEGVLRGRGGKGSIFVWASGNGGGERDNCNCDGYTNSIWTLSISSAAENGSVPWYSEACSSTLATAYSSGAHGQKQIVTTDLHHSCTPSHTGTSAAAPLAAGICALTLEANRNLTWRDMQHIVVRTAKPDHLVADDWQVNGVGRKVSHSFGYGLMDAFAMVKLARVWNSVAPQQFCQIRSPSGRKLISPNHSSKFQLIVADCPNVNFMEHVQVVISLSTGNRGDIQIHVTSPSGTRSTLLARRPLDTSHNGFHSWPFMSVHFWGESPFGIWTLEVENEGHNSASLIDWMLTVYGTKELPEEKKNHSTSVPEFNKLKGRLQQTAFTTTIDLDVKKDLESTAKTDEEEFPPALQLTDEQTFKTACEIGFYLREMDECVKTCPNGSHPVNHTGSDGSLIGVCAPCHYSCLLCNGPSDSECTICHPDSQIKITFTPGTIKPNKHCYPDELVKELIVYENWSIGVELALAVNLALVVALVVYLLCSRKSCNQPLSHLVNCCRNDQLEWQPQLMENPQQGNYHRLVSQSNPHNPPTHHSSTQTSHPNHNEN